MKAKTKRFIGGVMVAMPLSFIAGMLTRFVIKMPILAIPIVGALLFTGLIAGGFWLLDCSDDDKKTP